MIIEQCPDCKGTGKRPDLFGGICRNCYGHGSIAIVEPISERATKERMEERRLVDRAKALNCSIETMRFIEILESRIRALEIASEQKP